MMTDVENPPAVPRETGSRARVIGTVLVLIALAFAGGFIPKEMQRREIAAQLDQARTDLRLARLHRLLGVATVQALRNDFPASTTAAVDFFAGCREASTLDLAARPRLANALSAYAGQRDEIVSLLAAGDPAVKQRLLDLFLAMDGVLERRD